jgi:hypothetical protein
VIAFVASKAFVETRRVEIGSVVPCALSTATAWVCSLEVSLALKL